MKDISIELTKLKELFVPIAQNFSSGKKQYLNSILDKIITELNYRENTIGNLNSKLSGLKDKDEYDNFYNQLLDILILMGIDSSLTILNFRKDFLTWMIEHKEELKRPFTYQELINTYKMIMFYEGLENKMPLNFAELKKYWNDQA